MNAERVTIPLRVGFQQRALPGYRVEFFDELAAACKGGLSVFAGQPRQAEAIQTAATLQTAHLVMGSNRHYFAKGLYFYRQVGLLDWLNHWDPEVLVTEVNPRNLSLAAAVRWMHRRNRRVIGWGLGAPAKSGFPGSLLQRNWRRFIRRFDALVTYSQQGAVEYRAAGFPSGRIFVAPNASTCRPVFPMPERAPDYHGRPVVLYVGRLQPRKRVDLLFRACAALPPEIQPRLWIIGDGPARTELETLAESIYPLAELPGARHGNELEPFFLKADLFVLPGTGGLAIQQAMSYGLPVIAAEADGTQQDLVRPTNGWQVTPGDLAELTQTLQLALTDVQRLRQMGKISYQIVRDEINVELMVKIFIQVLGVDL